MRNLIFFMLLGAVALSVSGQNDTYTRKSVTFLDAIILASPDARNLSLNQISYIGKTVKERVQLPRFDFNPLPENSPLTREFISEVNSRNALSVDEIAEIMNRTFVPEIVKIMDEYAEQRASELVDEATKMSFITTKAKDMGITAENLEQVLNSGFIYLPYMNGYSRAVDSEKEDDKTKYTVTVSIGGGIFWFKIAYMDGKTSVKPVVKNESTSIGFATKYDFEDAEENAFEAAVLNYARNLENATKEYDEFKLTTQVAEVVGTQVGFRMGKREGLRIDDRFIVGEYVESSNGEMKFKRDGFVRIGQIADNRENASELSHGYGVIVGDWAPGMSLVEYPRLNLDIYILMGTLPLSTESSLYDVEGGGGLGAEIAYNLGGITQTPHWYFDLAAMIGGASITDSWTGDDIFDSVTRFLVSGSVMKRMQWRRFDAYGQLGFAHQQTWGNWDDSMGDTYTDRNANNGLLVGLGLNYTLSIDLTAGIRYSLYTGESDEWTRYNADNEEVGSISGPALRYSGSGIAFQIIYAPPSLAFDPASTLSNMIP
ncbi:MAG: hypothetical protein K9N11_09100 [Lentisphaeria bacterium]|nr:hypothetical protein [Candidatus Neomarinimicrobiota bacterium]MCF7842995.1 hypothetical protein [Lentisphaeria bacterium]